ncbi:vexin [Echinops telfairi]|uniref:Vexin n=1 Tax=Echinops telfairi TaxID=9371 RepID=A0ABM0IDJ2_ECHTE|nr:vexin [Echinops telfairi]
MHPIYSCSDEKIEVFTTVIPPKASSPARRRVKSSQHLLTKHVVIESDLYASRPLELLPHRSDRLHGRDSEACRFGRLQNARQQGPHPAKTPVRPARLSDAKSSNLCGNRAYGKSLIPLVPRISVNAPVTVEAAATGLDKGTGMMKGSRHLKKMAEEYPALPQGAEASRPLTGGASCGVPSILRKMWMRHTKKSEYVGATNSAFEAD